MQLRVQLGKISQVRAASVDDVEVLSMLTNISMAALFVGRRTTGVQGSPHSMKVTSSEHTR